MNIFVHIHTCICICICTYVYAYIYIYMQVKIQHSGYICCITALLKFMKWFKAQLTLHD